MDPVHNKGKRPMIVLKRILPVFAVLLMVAGCGGGGEIPQERFFRLSQPVPPQGDTGQIMHGTLEVPRFIANGLLNERAIAFSWEQTPSVLRQYRTQFWADAPGLMLQDRLARYLQQANVAPRVVMASYGTRADYFIRGEVQRMELVAGENPKAVLEMDLGLVRNQDATILLAKTYRAERAISQADPLAGVEGMDQALVEIFDAFLADLRRLRR